MIWVFFLLFFPSSIFCQFTYYSDYIPTSSENVVIHKNFYSISYIENTKLSEWSIYQITSEKNEKNLVSRLNYFSSDTMGDIIFPTHNDYTNSGYHRGHLVPARDMAFSKTSMIESFLTTNIAPQSPSFNTGIWKRLENYVRKYAMVSDTLIIISGPVIQKDSVYQKIGSNLVYVPKLFYKIIVDKSKKSTLSFLIPNEKQSMPIDSFLCNIEIIEKMTGVDFFYRLSDAHEKKLQKYNSKIVVF